MRAGVGRADHRAAVAPHREAGLPVVVGLDRGRRAEAGVELVGERDVAEHVPRRRGPRPRRCRRHDGRGTARSRARRRRTRSCSPSRARLRSGLAWLCACSFSLSRAARSRNSASFSSIGRTIASSQPGMASSTNPRPERQADREAHRHGERDHLAAVLAGVVAGLELGEALAAGCAAVTASTFQFSGALRRDRHVGHQRRRPTARTGRPWG